MPAMQLLCAAIELGANRVLALDPQSQGRMQALKGKRLAVHVKELPAPIVFVFSQQIDVLCNDDEPDCLIRLGLSTLPALQQNAELTRLIREGKLDVAGDLAMAQQVSELFRALDIDLFEILSRYTGDALAHKIQRLTGRFSQSLRQGRQSFSSHLRDIVRDEKPLIAPATAFDTFRQQTQTLSQQAASLEQRLSALEGRKA